MRSLRLVLLLVAQATWVPLVGCDFINTPTKVANGQLYQAGDGRYDPYFNSVHQEQLAAANWPEESKAARRPIITALNLKTGASNQTILSATREKKGDAALGQPIEETKNAEREFARKLYNAADKLDELAKHGEELKKQTVEDRKNLGANKADPKAVDKKNEIKREMAAAVDAAESMASDARKAAKEADELANRLKSAWTGKDEDREDHSSDKDKHEEKKPEPPPPKDEHPDKDDPKRGDKPEPKKPPPKKPAPKPDVAATPKKPPPAAAAAKPEPADKPEPPPKKAPPPKPEPAEKPEKPAAPQKPPDEVFNP